MKKIMKTGIILTIIAVMLSACMEDTTTVSSSQTIADQNAKKADQAAKVMEKTQVPTFTESLDRENIRDRLIVTNNANTLQWVYLFSAGRNIGRFPVRGKVTSGGKRLSSPEMVIGIDKGEFYGQELTEAPDEMGTYGSSGPYIFWFDPAGQYHQWQGDYFLSPVPYKIDKDFGTITSELDITEDAKRAAYEKEILANPDVTKVTR